MIKTKPLVLGAWDAGKVSYLQFRMESDGRKWKKLAIARKNLFVALAIFGSADGKNIFPSIETLMDRTGYSHGWVCKLLDDLKKLGLTNRVGRKGQRGAAVRSLLLPETATIETNDDSRAATLDAEPVSRSPRFETELNPESPRFETQNPESPLFASESPLFNPENPLMTGREVPSEVPKQKNHIKPSKSTRTNLGQGKTERATKRQPHTDPIIYALTDHIIAVAQTSDPKATFTHWDRVAIGTAITSLEPCPTKEEFTPVIKTLMRNIPENKSSSDVGSVIGATLSSKFIQYRDGLVKATAEKIRIEQSLAAAANKPDIFDIPKNPDALTPEQELANRYKMW